MNDLKKTQTFKEYYDSNPEFRQRHLEKLKEGKECECGCIITRGNFSKHLKSKKHIKKMVKKIDDPELTKIIADLDISYKMALDAVKTRIGESEKYLGK